MTLVPRFVATRQPLLADHSADRRMVLLAAMAVLVGCGGAAAAWLLINLIALATNIAWFGRMSVQPSAIAAASGGFTTILIPVIGSLIIGLMARFGSDKIRGHGIPEAIEAVLYGQSRLSPKVAVLKPLSSAISIGTGGPFGAEGPIIMTGGAIGSLFAQCFHLSGAERKTLLVAGAAAGMTAIFGTPVAAILLALEVMLFEWKPRSLVPVVVGALTALILRPLLVGSGPLFPVTGAFLTASWVMPAAAALGLVVGLTASFLSATLYRIEDLFHRLPIHWMWWPALGAVGVGAGGLVDPRVLGAGYANIQALLDGSMAPQAMLLLLAVKAAVWLVALGSGTSGGVLAPLLIMGGAIGGIAGHLMQGDAGFWALVGMAGILSGAMRAPLMGAVFAVELTGRLDALPATAAAAFASYALAVLVLRRSILTEKVARRGRHISQEFSVDPLALTAVGQIMTAAPQTLAGTMPGAVALDFFEAAASHRCYPVTDEGGTLLGLIERAEALAWRDAGTRVPATLGALLANRPFCSVAPGASALSAAQLMLSNDLRRLPVVDSLDGRRLIGLLSRSDLLRARLDRHREEHQRDRFFSHRRGAAAAT